MRRITILLAGMAALLCLGGAVLFLLTRPKMVSVEALPVKHIDYWQNALAKPLAQRIGPAPAELVDYLEIDNQSMGYPNSPSEAEVPEDFLDDVTGAIADMPPKVRQLVDAKLAGVYFVHNLGGTALSDYIAGKMPGHDAGFVVLDVDVLTQRSANAWATWKESTPFKTDPHARLAATIEEPGQDNRRQEIQYILLHEFGHILSIDERFHPRWDRPAMALDDYPFAQLSWFHEKDGRYYHSRFDNAFTLRADVVYYLRPRLVGNKMASVYEQLEQTNFPTLYAATSPGDDFAESFASYVHTTMQKKPFEIRLYNDDVPVKTYHACWEEPRCAEKRKMLDAVFAR
jgi:hypothetical protein